MKYYIAFIILLYTYYGITTIQHTKGRKGYPVLIAGIIAIIFQTILIYQEYE